MHDGPRAEHSAIEQARPRMVQHLRSLEEKILALDAGLSVRIDDMRTPFPVMVVSRGSESVEVMAATTKFYLVGGKKPVELGPLTHPHSVALRITRMRRFQHAKGGGVTK